MQRLHFRELIILGECGHCAFQFLPSEACFKREILIIVIVFFLICLLRGKYVIDKQALLVLDNSGDSPSNPKEIFLICLSEVFLFFSQMNLLLFNINIVIVNQIKTTTFNHPISELWVFNSFLQCLRVGSPFIVAMLVGLAGKCKTKLTAQMRVIPKSSSCFF